tara:strand:+ start:4242 stop:5879 length:1638 start_codon:yes stop_codon:yes gene_type:complete
MNELKNIASLVEEELNKFQIDDEVDVRFSNFSENTDIQINSLLKIKKDENFNKIVSSIKEKFKESIFIESFEIVDSGFINIKLSSMFLEKSLQNHRKNILNKNEEDKGTVIFDYGGANIGKSLHVGHIRTLNIGRSLTNIYKIAGYKTITDIHFGDWGMPLALIIAYIEDKNIDIETLSSDDLEEIYPNASSLSKENEKFYSKALNISKEMNLKNEHRVSQWKKIYDVSTKNIKSLLSDLNFNFDYYLGESDVISLLPDFINNLKKKNLVKIDDGALIANDSQDPPALITKSDGSYMYLTTDIGTILYREKNFNPDYYIYVVDQRQKNHFNQLFNLVNYFKLSKAKFEHVPFGTVNDKKGKPMKTRDGKNYKLIELYKDLINKLSVNNLDSTIVSTLAKSVLTYSDLVTKRTGNYIFDIDKFTNVSGKSAIFIQYSQVRAKKLIDQSGFKSQLSSIGNDERELVIEILKFSHFFKMALETNEPHHLAEYAYSLCHEFNKFYTNNKIFSEEIKEDLKLHRLYIVENFYQTITKVFNCLGIEPVSEM